MGINLSQFYVDPTRHPAGVTLVVKNGKLERADQNNTGTIMPAIKPSGTGSQGQIVYDPDTGLLFLSDGNRWRSLARGTMGTDFGSTYWADKTTVHTQNSYLQIDAWSSSTNNENNRYVFKTVGTKNGIGINAPGTGAVCLVLARLTTDRNDTNFSTLDRRFRFTMGGLGNWFEEWHMSSATNAIFSYPSNTEDLYDSAVILPWVSGDFSVEYSNNEPCTIDEQVYYLWMTGKT